MAEMYAAGDWLVPTVNGQVFAEKPILYFWLALVASHLMGGVSELALRLPSALAGCALPPLTYLLIAPYAGRRRALMGGIFIATTFVVFWSARQVQMDLLLGTCVLASVLAATRALDGLARPVPAWCLAGVAAGAGFLAKGPVGVLLPALVVATYGVATGRARALVKRELCLAVVACAAISIPWLATLVLRGEPGFLRELLLRQNLLRFVEPWDHSKPFWYYLAYLWVDLAPWAWLVPLAWGLNPKNEQERRLTRLSWSWIVSIVAFFSLSAAKRSPYILPVAPAVAALAAAVIERALDHALSRGRTFALNQLVRLLGAIGLALGLALSVGLVGAGTVPPSVIEAGRVVGRVLCAAGAVVLATNWFRRLRPAIPAVVAVVYLVAAAIALPALDPLKSSRAFSTAVAAQVGQGELRGFHEWRWRAGYAFYARRPIPNLETLDELRAYWSRPERVFLIVERGRLVEARKVLGDAEPLVSSRIGSNEAFLFASRPATRAAALL